MKKRKKTGWEKEEKGALPGEMSYISSHCIRNAVKLCCTSFHRTAIGIYVGTQEDIL